MAGTVLIYSRDPGGTNQMLAVHAALDAMQRGVVPAWLDGAVRDFLAGLAAKATLLRVAARDIAMERWTSAGVDAEDWSGLASAECVSRMMTVQPNQLLTATTDVDDRTDQALWKAAQGSGIASAAFLDHTVNLVERFRDGAGALTWPDRIFVFDESGRRTLAAAGIPPAGIAIGGDLHLARMAAQRPVTAEKRSALRQRWGVAPADHVILFAGENGREMARAGRPAGYDEIRCLERLIERLDRGQPVATEADPLPPRWTLIVRPHPKDTIGKYDRFRRAGHHPVIVDDGDREVASAIAAADLVVGMRSTLLAEAHALGIPTVSVLEEEVAS